MLMGERIRLAHEKGYGILTQGFVKKSRILPAHLAPWSDFNFDEWKPGFAMAAHRHDFLQVIHVLAGSLEVHWGKGWETLAPGMAHILPPGHPHRLRSPGGHRQFGLNFTRIPDARGILAEGLRLCVEPKVLRFPLSKVLEKSLMVWSPGTTWDSLQISHILEGHTLSFFEALRPKEGTKLAERILMALKSRGHGPLSVEEVARSVGVGRATLQRGCREHFGVGVAHLQERLRLERAAELLLHKSTAVGEISESLGYPDIFSFSRAFKRVYGKSPRAFRTERQPPG